MGTVIFDVTPHSGAVDTEYAVTWRVPHRGNAGGMLTVTDDLQAAAALVAVLNHAAESQLASTRNERQSCRNPYDF